MGPMCAFAARLVAENENIVVTILTIADYYEKSRFEIDRQLASPSSAQRVRFGKSFIMPETVTLTAYLEGSPPSRR
ncbi:hypothetical protein DXG01_009559 [Tephrocybe rancida]|nr:hypothetical protein DXG01_009559 [Tephrocybe rancida]